MTHGGRSTDGPRQDDAPRAPAPQPDAPAVVVAPGALRSTAQMLALQRSAGNQAVGRLLLRDGPTAPPAPAPAPAAAPDPTSATEPFELGGAMIATYGDGAAALTLW